MATTTNYSWTTPDDTALVKDGAAAIRSLGTAIDTTVFTNAGNAIAKTIVDAKGDLIAATAADTVSRLGVGSNGQLLAANSATATGLEWQTVSSGGMTLITTTTFNNTAATYTYSSLGSYKHLMIVIDNMTRNNASSVDNLVMQFNGVTTGAPYHSIAFGTNNETFAAVSGFNDANYLLLGWRSIANTTIGEGGRGQVSAWIYDYAGSTKKIYNSIGRQIDSTNNRAASNIGMWNSTNAITSITIFTESTNNFNTGTLKLYGVS